MLSWSHMRKLPNGTFGKNPGAIGQGAAGPGASTADDAEPGRRPKPVRRTPADVDRYLNQIRKAASRTSNWVSQSRDPLERFRLMKFILVGCHPIEDRPLNLMEQINQTWMYVVTLEAARLLLTWHPEAGGFHLAPGAGTALQLDIMSETAGVVGAETFAAVDPENNDKLNKDLAKMAKRDETYRYVFFMSPLFPNTQQQHKLERVDGVKVWSVAAPTLKAVPVRTVAP
jgi:hypothetical protein